MTTTPSAAGTRTVYNRSYHGWGASLVSHSVHSGTQALWLCYLWWPIIFIQHLLLCRARKNSRSFLLKSWWWAWKVFFLVLRKQTQSLWNQCLQRSMTSPFLSCRYLPTVVLLFYCFGEMTVRWMAEGAEQDKPATFISLCEAPLHHSAVHSEA